ncbi:MAG: FHIPEP family type III secretion protein, partial [Planctomycetaceae bacterium]|nr:FHIPEP family type III secretion protein [Planctomycetaceae bacterium]
GKQMSIDAELNAGAIDEQEAKHRREQLAQETEFYGAMDGASKFVRGDAIAGMIITAINLIGGMALGMTHGMSLMDSLSRYSILTVGDGLISQIPALIIAITAGILVTKTTSDHTLGQEIEHQVFRQERPLWIGMGVIGLLALMPGIPKFPFLGLGIGLLLLLARRPSKTPSTESSPPDPRPHGTAPPDDGIDDFLIRDRATVEVGTGLITLVNAHRGKPLADRITSLRKDLARDRGLWIPPIRVRSQLHLHADAYRVLIAGRVVGSGTLRAEKMLAIPPDSLAVAIPGEETLEPAFQLPAKWIDPSLTHQAESHRYTVVDAASVLITHLGEVLKSHAHELLTREALKELLDQVRQFAPTIVDELRSESVRMAVLHQVLQQLAEDSVPLSDFAFILEAISNCGQQHKAPDELADAVRVQLGRLVCERSRNSQGALRIVAFEPRLEARFRELVRDGQLALAPRTLEKLLSVLRDAWQRSHRQNLPLALLVEKSLRRPVRKLLKRAVPPLPVIAYQEVPSDMELDPVDVFREEQIFDAKDLLPKANPPVSANPTETTPAQRAA